MSTYARLFIGFNESISNIIKQTSRQSLARKTQVLPITILSSLQVNQSLSHPQNQSLKYLIGTAYKDYIKASRLIIYGEDSLKEQHIFIEEILKSLKEAKKEATAASKVNIERLEDTLNQQYKLLNNIKNYQTHGQTQLNDINADLSQLATKHDQQWSQYRDKMLAKLQIEIQALLDRAGLPSLPQGEIDNLLREDLQDVLDRFEDRGASKDLPATEMSKLLGLEKPDLDTYLKMKAYLAIRSVHTSRENIGQLLHQLDPLFKEAKDEGKQLVAKQEAEINTIENEKVKPVVQVSESNKQTLDKLEQDRDQLLKVAATIDVQKIRGQAVQRITEAPTAPKIRTK